MNKPIKFRIWDTETQTFLQELAPYYWHVPRSLGLFDDEIVGEANLHDLSALLSNKGFMAQQFTGLLDKNDREIYEGDIVLVKRNRSTFDESIYEEMKLEVKYLPNKGFKAYWGHNDCNSEPLEGSVIIGSIFQTPELLKTI